MRGALIHGVLLVVMLVYGYRTWTRDKSVQPDHGSVVLWDKAESDLVSIELKGENKITKLERRGQGGDSYWWGVETTIEKKVKPTPPTPPPAPAAGSGSAAAGSGSAAAGSGSAAAGSGSAAATPPAVAEEETRKTHEFPVGESAENLLKGYAKARALRDLGTPSEEQAKDYKLNESKSTLTVTFKDGTRSFAIGGSVYGGSDRYASDEKAKRAYVLSKDLISSLEIGESSLQLLEPRGFDALKIESVAIEANDKSKTVARVKAGGDAGQQVNSWGDPATKKADQTIANFIDNTNNLRPTEYKTELKVAELTKLLKLTYKDVRGTQLGTLTLYKHSRPGELPFGQELDPANPPPNEAEYLIMTEKTRVPAVVRKDTAERIEQDITTVFSEHPTEAAPKEANPFGDQPLPPPPPKATTPPGAKPPGGAPPGAMPPGGAPPGAHGGHGPDDGHGHGAPAPGGGAVPPVPPGGAAKPGAAPAAPGGAAKPAAPPAPKADAPKPAAPAPKAEAKPAAPAAPKAEAKPAAPAAPSGW